MKSLNTILITAGMFVTCGWMNAQMTQDSERVSSLLSDVKTHAYQLREDASQLESYTWMNAGWETHAGPIARIKEHINEAGKTLDKLEAIRGSASPWQAIAIDRIRPLLKEMAANTEAVIGFVNKNPRRLFQHEYKDYVEANADMANQLSQMISDFINYGNTKNRLEHLANRLEIPVSSN